MSQSATPATRNEATKRWKPPKMTPPAELTIGTAIRGSHERLRTVATVNATSSEQTLNPQTPRVKREPVLRIREKPAQCCQSEIKMEVETMGKFLVDLNWDLPLVCDSVLWEITIEKTYTVNLGTK